MTGWLSDGAHAGDRYLSTGAKNDIALPQVAGFVHYLVQSNTRKMKKALIIKGFFHSLGGEGDCLKAIRSNPIPSEKNI